MEVLSGFMKNEVKQAQSRGTSMMVLSFPGTPPTPTDKFSPFPPSDTGGASGSPDDGMQQSDNTYLLALSWVCSFSLILSCSHPHSTRERATTVRGTPVYTERPLGCIPVDSAS